MAIDIEQEDLVRLNQLRRLKCLRVGRHGKRFAVGTLYRWAIRGVGGVRLETVKVGGSLWTSAEALHRFLEARTAAAGGLTSTSSVPTRQSQTDEIGGRSPDAQK